MELFYTTNINEDVAELSEDESLHCIKILRNKSGDKIRFADGKGFFYEGIIREASKKVKIDILSKTPDTHKRDYQLHIVMAPTKSIDRTEFFVEKAIEIGIDQITFIRSERSERKEVKIERLNKIAVAAMKQSKKAYLPVIEGIITFKDFIKAHSGKPNSYIACLTDQNQVSFQNILQSTTYTILIGPEGDFTPAEIGLAIDNKILPLSLGKSILRTETAGIVACSWVSFLNKNF